MTISSLSVRQTRTEIAAPTHFLTTDGISPSSTVGYSTAANTRSGMGLGTIATQAADAVNITGGTVSGTAVSQHTITYAASVDLDMAALTNSFRTISLTGNLTFTSSNRAAGRYVTIRLICDGSTRTLTFPVGWKFMGTKPTDIAASKTAMLTILFFDDNDTDAVCAYAVEA
jgi:hypothetical protein